MVVSDTHVFHYQRRSLRVNPDVKLTSVVCLVNEQMAGGKWLARNQRKEAKTFQIILFLFLTYVS